jgi:hypothetical protein
MNPKSPMKAPETTSQDPQLQVEWNLPEGVEKFSEGHVYHAYRLGINEGRDQDAKLLNKIIYDNSVLAAQDTMQLTKEMQKLGIRPISAHLKITSRYSFRLLITVSSEDFVKESFAAVYEKANNIQRKSKTDFYSLSFTFINRTDSFDEDLVRLDGFLASFKPLEQATK